MVKQAHLVDPLVVAMPVLMELGRSLALNTPAMHNTRPSSTRTGPLRARRADVEHDLVHRGVRVRGAAAALLPRHVRACHRHHDAGVLVWEAANRRGCCWRLLQVCHVRWGPFGREGVGAELVRFRLTRWLNECMDMARAEFRRAVNASPAYAQSAHVWPLTLATLAGPAVCDHRTHDVRAPPCMGQAEWRGLCSLPVCQSEFVPANSCQAACACAMLVQLFRIMNLLSGIHSCLAMACQSTLCLRSNLPAPIHN